MPRTADCILHRGLELERRAHRHVVDGYLLRTTEHQVCVEVVVQVLAHPGHVVDHRDAELAQEIGGAEPGKLQQLWRTIDAAGDDDLAAGPCSSWPARRMVFDPDRAALLK